MSYNSEPKYLPQSEFNCRWALGKKNFEHYRNQIIPKSISAKHNTRPIVIGPIGVFVFFLGLFICQYQCKMNMNKFRKCIFLFVLSWFISADDRSDGYTIAEYQQMKMDVISIHLFIAISFSFNLEKYIVTYTPENN